MFRGSPVYMEDQHKAIVSQTAPVDILGWKCAEEKCVASSTMCRSGWKSKYIMSIYIRGLKRIFACPIDARNRSGAFLIR